MGWLDRWRKRDPKKSAASDDVDKTGIYFHLVCGRCQTRLRLRADQQYDLNQTDDGYIWHKTIVCRKCFQQMPAVVTFDAHYHVATQEIERGRFVSAEEYAALEAAGP